MASLLLLGNILGSRTLENIEIDNIGNFLTHILFQPSGTYWYLHTLIISMFVVYMINRLIKFQNGINTLIISSLLLFGLTLTGMNFHWENVQYFIFGLVIKSYDINLVDKKFASVLSVIPIIIITIFSHAYLRGDISGVGLSIFVLSFLTAVHQYTYKHIQHFFEYLGRNSLSIVLFSPFTLTALRFFIKPFSFGSLNVLYAVIIVSLAIAGCLLTAIISDKLKISQIIVGKDLYSKQ